MLCGVVILTYGCGGKGIAWRRDILLLRVAACIGCVCWFVRMYAGLGAGMGVVNN